ncbi:hypothetical protein AAJ76_3800014254 [Vairimorpha ceranae]|uniref:Uncharacterized protein n=1 Tax=Vairimorpha ceranae TaxID=40302 RepID=A0A0F9WDR6_9MICR|nr:hypothetical protein AAJ76_3800014254 [Vairimorpha ceranae]KAF5140274.1 hypothetical protein G9O61_00g015300 [Vairimorpha ceranae]KKO74935.1 hypothetical protein AAJ76_3800014254 [Vairimorpha ceranae]
MIYHLFLQICIAHVLYLSNKSETWTKIYLAFTINVPKNELISVVLCEVNKKITTQMFEPISEYSLKELYNELGAYVEPDKLKEEFITSPYIYELSCSFARFNPEYHFCLCLWAEQINENKSAYSLQHIKFNLETRFYNIHFDNDLKFTASEMFDDVSTVILDSIKKTKSIKEISETAEK